MSDKGVSEGGAKLMARLAAIEWGICNAHRLIYQMARLPKEEIWQGHDETIVKLGQQSLAVGSDPALIDLLSDETLRAIQRLLTGIENQTGIPRK